MTNSETEPPHQPLSAASTAILVAVVMLWGANSVAVNYSVDSLPPVAVAGLRFAMGTFVLFFWCLIERTSFRITRQEAWMSLDTGCFLFTQISTFNIGVKLSNSTHGAMLVNTFVFFVAAIEHFAGADRLNARRMIGLVLAAVGVVLVMQTRETDSHPEDFLRGDALLILSAILLAIRVVYIRSAVQHMQPSKLMFWHGVFGVAMFAATSLATESFADAKFTMPATLGLLYQGLVVAGLCFVLHASLLKKHSASQVAVFSFATPVFAFGFSVVLRGEPFTIFVVLGACCVALGIWLVTAASRQ
ncbi:MAG: DMT family transporter [Planctomycetales bacterium]|nr:DMT family transporter [Planctomycetales bacterium]